MLDLQPGDIDILICTHFDLDHCGHHEDFPNAELVVQREHYDVAREGHQRCPHWDLPVSRYHLVDGDTTLLPGLELVETGGHVLMWTHLSRQTLSVKSFSDQFEEEKNSMKGGKEWYLEESIREYIMSHMRMNL